MYRFSNVYFLVILFALVAFGSKSAGSVVSSRSSAGGCDQAVKIPNGFATFVDRENVALFECNPGFVPYGNMKASCIDGTWDQEPPVCARKGCEQLKIPVHGQAEEVYGGAVVKFQCDSGYQLQGDDHLFCDGKQWSGLSPSCEALPKAVVKHAELDGEKVDL